MIFQSTAEIISRPGGFDAPKPGDLDPLHFHVLRETKVDYARAGREVTATSVDPAHVLFIRIRNDQTNSCSCRVAAGCSTDKLKLKGPSAGLSRIPNQGRGLLSVDEHEIKSAIVIGVQAGQSTSCPGFGKISGLGIRSLKGSSIVVFQQQRLL